MLLRDCAPRDVVPRPRGMLHRGRLPRTRLGGGVQGGLKLRCRASGFGVGFRARSKISIPEPTRQGPGGVLAAPPKYSRTSLPPSGSLLSVTVRQRDRDLAFYATTKTDPPQKKMNQKTESLRSEWDPSGSYLLFRHGCGSRAALDEPLLFTPQGQLRRCACPEKECCRPGRPRPPARGATSSSPVGRGSRNGERVRARVAWWIERRCDATERQR